MAIKFRCNFCAKEIFRFIETKTHINIEQLSPKHVFCSRICKFAWIEEKIREKRRPELFKGPWFHKTKN